MDAAQRRQGAEDARHHSRSSPRARLGRTALADELPLREAPAHRPAAEIFEGLRQRNIFVRYFPGPRTGERLRISVGTDADMDTLLAVLADLDKPQS